MFGGVDLFPCRFAEALEVENGKRRRGLRGDTKNMNYFLGDGTMLFVGANLKLSQQAIRHVFDAQTCHRSLQIYVDYG